MTTQATVLILVGITGDLARRKLLPAIGKLAEAGALPEHFRVVGITRRADVNLGDLFSQSSNASYLTDHTELFQVDLNAANDYARLSSHLDLIEQSFGVPAQRLFYLSVPPQVSSPIIEHLGTSGLSRAGETRLLLEKPFGVDLASAKQLAEHIDRFFAPEQVYRIDHYLAKEMAQNLLIFRASNPLFEKTWNKDFIERIEITASEAIGIEGRTTFYEQTGALRDLIQSHLLQLVALVLMETPETESQNELPSKRLQALKQLELSSGAQVLRGQYEGYRDEVGNPESLIETFASITLTSKDPRWEGVLVRVSTGKALSEKLTQIQIYYRGNNDSNVLTLRLQPNEGIELSTQGKRPGYEGSFTEQTLRFSYSDHYEKMPEGYEQVIYNALISDPHIFVSADEVIEAWRIVEPVQDAWKASPDDLVIYKQGSSLDEVIGV